ncbi:MAG: glycoside hydrolase family 28 protein [Clostridia bacterium]|nr:glycoside hydrolase family 28 protein [Clostridia bacterium]
MLKNGLSSIIFDNEITVYWNRVVSLSENDCYRVYLNGDPIAQTRKTHFEFFDLTPETEYTVKVELKTNNKVIPVGNESYITKKTPVKIDVTKAPYFAAGDGTTLNTDALQKALDDCKAGQAVYFPEGVYLTGALNVRSNTEIIVDKNATIQGSVRSEDYLPLIKSRSEGLNMMCFRSLINMGELDENADYNCENVVIRGGGSIIGGGNPLHDDMLAQGYIRTKDYVDSLSEEELSEFQFGAKTIAGRLRGRLVNISNTQNVILSNIHFANGPYWNIHFIYSDSVIMKSCEIKSAFIHNGDGWNPDSSTNCSCFNTDFDCGDNCIAIKSGRNPDGNRIGRPTENINIFDCHVTSGGGFAIGSEMSGGVRDVTMWNIDGEHGSVGFQFKTTRKRGGYIKHVKMYDSIVPCFNIKTALNYNNDGEGAPTLSRVEDFLCGNCVLTGTRYERTNAEGAPKYKSSAVPAIAILGFDDRVDLIDKIVLRNCTVRPTAEVGQSILINNFSGVTIENLKVK